MPRSPASSGDFARTLRRFADGTSVCRQRTGPHPAGHPSGFSLRVLAAAQGDPGKKKSAAVLAAEAVQRRCARLLLRLLISSPCDAAEGGRSGPKGRRDGSRRFRCGPGMARQRNPAARSEPAAGGRVTRVPFLLVTSLWASKEK